MTLNQFVQENNLRPGDAVVVKKNNIGLLDHYLIYLGQWHGEHKFIANYFSGTKILGYPEISNFSQKYDPTRIRRFLGNEIQRKVAVDRALSRRDQQSYHLILNNCEHYANYVQYGTDYSQQSAVFGTGMTVTGLAVAASSKSDEGKLMGAAMTILGLLTLMIEKNK